jgi:hypothetical protein
MIVKPMGEKLQKNRLEENCRIKFVCSIVHSKKRLMISNPKELHRFSQEKVLFFAVERVRHFAADILSFAAKVQ